MFARPDVTALSSLVGCSWQRQSKGKNVHHDSRYHSSRLQSFYADTHNGIILIPIISFPCHRQDFHQLHRLPPADVSTRISRQNAGARFQTTESKGFHSIPCFFSLLERGRKWQTKPRVPRSSQRLPNHGVGSSDVSIESRAVSSSHGFRKDSIKNHLSRVSYP